MKYKLILENNKLVDGKWLYRVQAIKPIKRYGVAAGDFGGYIEDETNLSQDGDCWVANEATVSGDSLVTGNALVSGWAKIKNSTVCQEAVVLNYATVINSVIVESARVVDKALVLSSAVCYNVKGSEVVDENIKQNHSTVLLSVGDTFAHNLDTYTVRHIKDGYIFMQNPYGDIMEMYKNKPIENKETWAKDWFKSREDLDEVYKIKSTNPSKALELLLESKTITDNFVNLRAPLVSDPSELSEEIIDSILGECPLYSYYDIDKQLEIGDLYHLVAENIILKVVDKKENKMLAVNTNLQSNGFFTLLAYSSKP